MAGALKTVVSLSVIYSLCLFYSSLTALSLLWAYIWKRDTKFWIPKEHKVQPKCLVDPKYGEHKFAQINGIKLHYVTKGSPDKPLMLFIHGFPEFWYSWRYQLIEFSKDYHTVAVDMRGYGDSEKPSKKSAYEMSNMRADIKGLIEHLGYKKCVLVCHDWGAAIGWSFVRFHMDMIDRYVMMGGPESTVWRKLVLSSLDQFRKSWYVFMFQMPKLPEFTFTLNDYGRLSIIGGRNKHNTFSAEDLEAYKYTFAKPGALTGPINYYRAVTSSKVVARPPKIEKFAPGLYALGDGDAYISRETGPLTQKIFKDLRFEIVKDSNHFLQQDNPVETNKLIRKFLAES